MQQGNDQHVRKRALQSIIWFHFAANLLHTTAHIGAGVMNLPLFETIYVIGIILLAPFVALFWLSRSLRQGAGVLACILLASFIFGFLHHLILPGDDLVASVTGIWALPFQLSAYLVLLLELVGMGLCLWILFVTRPSQPRILSPRREKRAEAERLVRRD